MAKGRFTKRPSVERWCRFCRRDDGRRNPRFPPQRLPCHLQDAGLGFPSGAHRIFGLPQGTVIMGFISKREATSSWFSRLLSCC
jgi:hypothetical protein